jgi:hypothetical protein
MTAGLWDFLSLPTNLNNALFGGTTSGLLTAQMMVTAFLVMIFILPAIMRNTKADVTITLVIFAVFLSTGLGWLPIPVMVGLIFIIALAWAGVFRRMVSG